MNTALLKSRVSALYLESGKEQCESHSSLFIDRGLLAVFFNSFLISKKLSPSHLSVFASFLYFPPSILYSSLSFATLYFNAYQAVV